MKRFLFSLVVLMLGIGSAYAYKQESIDINVNGQTRNMVVFTPTTTKDNMPLMIVTHGMNQSPEYQYDADKFYNLVDTAKFVVTYLRSDGSTWDIGGTKDQNFVEKTIEEMATRYKINKNRVYWSGFSMGSMLIYHCMANMQDKIAAFAPTSGIQFSEQPWNACTKPVNLIHCHAYGDDVFGYEDYGIHDYVQNMAQMNNFTTYIKLQNYNPGSWYTGDKEVWSSDQNGSIVELFSYNNGGHWPMDGNAKEIWNFCKRFSLQTIQEEYTAIYTKASNLILEWKDTPQMTSKTIYTNMKNALETYAPENMKTDADYKKAIKKLEAYITAFEKATAGVTKVVNGGAMEQPTTFDPNFHIYICFGQSNMEGNAAIEPQDRVDVDPRFRMMAAVDMSASNRTKGNWYVAYPPLCRANTGLTPADYFGREMVANLPDSIKVGIINVAVGGCTIELFDEDQCASIIASSVNWFQSYCREYNNNPYRTLIGLAKKAKKVGVIKGILLHQGCSNNSQIDWPVKVKRVYKRMLNDLELKEEETPLLIGELLSQAKGGVCWGHNSVIANTHYAIPNSYVISSANCPGAADGLHFTAEGYRMIGRRYAQTMLKLLGQTAQIDFDTTEDPMPLKVEAFNPSLYLMGTYKNAMSIGTFTSQNNGNFGGWRYSNGFDFSPYKYLVVQFARTPSCKPQMKFFDTDDYLNPHCTVDLGNQKKVVIELANLKNSNSKAVDLSHIYMLGFTTDATSALYISKVFLSNDGENPAPTAIESLFESTNSLLLSDDSWYDLSSRRVKNPSNGIFIRKGKKYFIP